jgi:hypothetical protein
MVMHPGAAPVETSCRAVAALVTTTWRAAAESACSLVRNFWLAVSIQTRLQGMMRGAGGGSARGKTPRQSIDNDNTAGRKASRRSWAVRVPLG